MSPDIDSPLIAGDTRVIICLRSCRLDDGDGTVTGMVNVPINPDTGERPDIVRIHDEARGTVETYVAYADCDHGYYLAASVVTIDAGKVQAVEADTLSDDDAAEDEDED